MTSPLDGDPGGSLSHEAVAARAFEQSPVAQLVVDADGTLVHAGRSARRTFSITSASLGRHVLELDLFCQVRELRSALERCLSDRIPVTATGLSWLVADRRAAFDGHLGPLEEGGALVALVEVTRYQHLREDLEESHRELATTCEALRSAVEELERTNEALRSANEELERTNEALHSTDQELGTSNDELRERGVEVARLNRFLAAVSGGLGSAVVVLGPEMDVRTWNRRAEDLWGLCGGDVIGHRFPTLDVGLPVEQLRPAIRRCLAGGGAVELTVPAVDRHGRAVSCAVHVTGFAGDEVPVGVILTMDADTHPADADGAPC